MSDDLETRLRAANPASVRRGDPVSARGLELLAELTGSAEPTTRASVTPLEAKRRRTVAPLVGAAAAAVAVVAVVVSLNGGGPGPASDMAGGAVAESAADSGMSEWIEPLAITESADGSASELLAASASLAADGTGTGAGPDGDMLRLTSWDAAGEYELLREGDGAEEGADEAQSYSLDGSSGGTADDAMAASAPWTEVPAEASDLPTDPDAVGRYLSDFSGLGASDLPGYFVATRVLLLQYALTAEQESALLEFFAGQDDIEVLGLTTDRAGREAYAFAAAEGAPVDLEYLLLVSPVSGEILSMETVYVGPAVGELESPSVIEYTLWDR